MTLHDRLPETTNGCFVEAKHGNLMAEHPAALEKLEGRVWVEGSQLLKKKERQQPVFSCPIGFAVEWLLMADNGTANSPEMIVFNVGSMA